MDYLNITPVKWERINMLTRLRRIYVFVTEANKYINRCCHKYCQRLCATKQNVRRTKLQTHTIYQ